MVFNDIKLLLEAENNSQKIMTPEQVMLQQAAKFYGYAPDSEPPTVSKELEKWKRGKKDFESAVAWNRHLNSQAKAREELDKTDRQIYDKNLRLKNKKEVIDNLSFTDEDTEKNNTKKKFFKDAINNFLHSNVGANFNAINADMPAFKASMNGEAIPGGKGYKSRWKHIVISMLSKKGYKQSDAQGFLDEKTSNFRRDMPNGKKSDKMADGIKLYPQGNNVIVSRDDYNRIREIHPKLPKAQTNGRQLVPLKYTKERDLLNHGGLVNPLSKTSDYMLEIYGKKILVTFKEVKQSGGAQDNQIKDVINTLNALKSNFNSTEENRVIAVIKGEAIENKLKIDKNGMVHVLTKDANSNWSPTNVWFQPIKISYKRNTVGQNGKVTVEDGKMLIPRVMTYSKWLAFLKSLKLETVTSKEFEKVRNV